MRVNLCKLSNFGSYKHLEFDFTKQGLTLIQGPTGSGKSTLCDAIPWILFGKTSKGGAVDEVLSWPGTKVTKGTLSLENVTISRSRGPKAKDNDLTYVTDGVEFRGKDITDTQKLINSLLGLDCELYLSGSYFHEFSQTAQFFTLSAKNRRQICEQIVDLSLAKKLHLNASDKHKQLNKQQNEVLTHINTLKSNIALLERVQQQETTKAAKWTFDHDKTMSYVQNLCDKFESTRKKVIRGSCPECGTQLKEDKHYHDDSPNPHYERLKELRHEKNPYTDGVKDYSQEIQFIKNELELANIENKYLNQDISDVLILLEVVSSFRASLIQNTVSYIEHQTNKLLNDHFDAEIRITLQASEADRLDVTIQKDGNEATFTQLSKGQRQLLKLCFATSVMKAVENHHSVEFPQIFYDEALDGLDENFKTKAYNLLNELASTKESVFVVEHSEGLKSMFPNAHNVRLINGHSEICQN